MAAKALVELAPGFAKDRDEDWMIYLTADKQTFLREKRRKYLAMNEAWEQCDLMFQTDLKSDPLMKQEKTNNHRQRYEQFLLKRDKMASKILDRVREYKDEGRNLQSLAIEREAHEIRKRRRLDEDDDSPGIDFAYDEYMPSSYLSRENAGKNAGKNRKIPILCPSPPPVPEPVSSTSRREKEQAADEAFLEGVPDNEVTILLELKPLIVLNSDIKEQTRDRVLTAIKSYKAKERTLNALDTFTKAIGPRRKGSSHARVSM